MGDIGLSSASRETTQTNMPPEHYTAGTSAVLLRKIGNIPTYANLQVTRERGQYPHEDPLLK